MTTQGISRRQFITGASAALAFPFVNLSSADAAERPNFVFILSDDLRYDAMSCAGHPFLRTPNIDRIANEGAKFTNAFVTTSLCSPSRASFLTGQYVHTHGVKDNKQFTGKLPTTFPEVLQAAGYDTAFIGKWHMGNNSSPRPGFSHWVSFKGQGPYRNPLLNIDGKEVRETGYMTDILTRYAVNWLKQPRKSPFCLYLSHKAVHGSWEPAIRHSKLFSDVEIPRPVSQSDDMKGKPKWLSEMRRGMKNYNEGYKNFVRNYNRTVMGVDDSVGSVLATLHETGALDNTVIVFAGDNGHFQGEHGLSDKRPMYEEAIRIPFLVRYPKMVRPGTTVDRITLNIDLCPTLIDMAGATVPEGVQGRSFRPLLQGRTSGWRKDFLYEYFEEKAFPIPTTRGVRDERWKYIEYPEIDDICELYDLKNDPYELRNLIDDPAHAGTVKRLRARLQELMKETA